MASLRKLHIWAVPCKEPNAPAREVISYIEVPKDQGSLSFPELEALAVQQNILTEDEFVIRYRRLE